MISLNSILCSSITGYLSKIVIQYNIIQIVISPHYDFNFFDLHITEDECL